MISPGTEPAGDEGAFVCTACGRRFDSEVALQRHVRGLGLVY